MTPGGQPSGPAHGGGEGPRRGVFGGSFDPPHLGHVLACVYARARYGLDAIHVVPTASHPFGKRLHDAAHRLAMTRLAFEGLPWCVVDAIEIERAAAPPGRPSWMIETIEALRAAHPGVAWHLVLGSDLAGQVRTWHRAEELLVLAPPLWVPRAGDRATGLDAGVPEAFPGWSSSAIREALRAGDRDMVAGCVPASVLRYVADHGLFADCRDTSSFV